jgi:hypothetical protein
VHLRRGALPDGSAEPITAAEDLAEGQHPLDRTQIRSGSRRRRSRSPTCPRRRRRGRRR